jgi:hypothetical protein
MAPILGIWASAQQSAVLPVLAYDSIATLSGNGSSSQLTFSSIPSTYTHLQIRLIIRGVRSFASEQLYIRLNGDGGGNYRYHYMYGDGTSAISGASGSGDTVFLVNEIPAANETANIYSTSVIDLLDYTNTNKNKTMRSLSGYNNNGNTGNYVDRVWFGSGLWINTAAVTSLTVLSNGAFTSGTSIALYGIKG